MKMNAMGFLQAGVTFSVTMGILCTSLNGLTSALAALGLTYGLVYYQQSLEKQRQREPGAPGPKPWPILGSLHLMDGYQIPYAAFTKLASIFGNVFKIRLGSSWCVVVNDPKSVKEVLITKGAHFDGRPTLKRLDLLFGGDKENSLAFCNNSEPQKKRRQILQKFTFPHSHSNLGNYLDTLCLDECQHLVGHLQNAIGISSQDAAVQIDLKPLIAKACANIFNRYFCSTPRSNYSDEDFSQYCQNFDQVFWEVNNGRAVDFLPWLMPIFQYSPAIRNMKRASGEVRRYVEEKIIAPKKKLVLAEKSNTSDFLDTIMIYLEGSGQHDDALNSQSALYALEDILGGHAAVANITLRILYDLALEDHGPVKAQVQNQINQVVNEGGLCNAASNEEGQALVSFEDRPSLPWVVASMHETIRKTCSPIVPHQATQDSTIEGHFVPKDAVIFVNNHSLNMSEELWDQPEEYQPSRFLDPTAGTFTKPSHFTPFSMGKRSCMGYKMVHNVAFAIVANLMLHFDLRQPAYAPSDVPLGMLALPPQPFEFVISSPAAEAKNSFLRSPTRRAAA